MSWREQIPTIEPDFQQLARVLRREVPDRIPAIELFADYEIMVEILGHGPEAIAADKTYADWQRERLWRIAFQKLAAPDYLNVPLKGLEFDVRFALADDTADLARDQRTWVPSTGGVIGTREDIERFPWPDPSFEALSGPHLDFAAENAPAGMGLIVNSGGLFEWATWLMGYETLSLNLYDNPDLVRTLVDTLGERFVAHYSAAAKHDAVRAGWMGEDMGYKTATMLAPEQFRTYFFPWLKRIVAAFHDQGKPFLLHSCGKLDAIMDDLIEDVGIDARHSYEDVIEPVASFKKRYGDRIAILGGVDMDFLTRQTPTEVKRYTRDVLEACAPDGGYALGSGNSIANYVPVANYVAMLQELADFNAAGR